MKQNIEFRLFSDEVRVAFGKPLGRDLGLVCVVRTEVGSGVMEEICVAHAAALSRGKRLIAVTRVWHTYTASEIASAGLFLARIREVPNSLEASSSRFTGGCLHCGAGRTLVGPAFFDLRKLKGTGPWAITADGMLIVTGPVLELFRRRRMTGCVQSIHLSHRPDFSDTLPTVLAEISSTRLLSEARKVGLAITPSTRLFSWCLAGPQRELLIEAWEELARKEERKNQAITQKTEWHAVICEGGAVVDSSKSVFGVGHCEPEDRIYSCPRQHVLGLNLLSELHLEREPGYDIAVTTGYVNKHLPPFLDYPRPLIVVSPRFRLGLLALKPSLSFEIAHVGR